MKQKELLEKLESLEREINSLKEKKQNKIHYLLLQIMGKYTKKQIFVFSIVFLFFLTLFVYAGTVTKNYTFSTGDVVSADKINANFNTLYTLVNGNLDDNNISGISSSKITSGTLSASRIDNISNTKIINDQIVIFNTYNTHTSWNTTTRHQTGGTQGNLGGRTGADALCVANKKRVTTHSCPNVRAFISVSASDEIRDMVGNYSVPENKAIYNTWGHKVTDNISTLLSGYVFYNTYDLYGLRYSYYWSGSDVNGAMTSNTCSGWTSTSGNGDSYDNTNFFNTSAVSCSAYTPLLCLCY